MYTTTPEFKSLMAEKSRTLTSRGLITFADATTQALTAAQIVSVNINEDAGSHIPIGSVSASTLTLRLDNRLGQWNPGGSVLGSKTLDGATVKVEIGVHNGTSFVYSNLGIYLLESAFGQEQQTTITIKGADYLANKAAELFGDSKTYPRTVKQILDEAVLQSGIVLKTTTFVNSTQSISIKPTWKDGTTCRDVIGFVACLAGGFARIDRDGKLEIIALKNSNTYALSPSRYKTFEDKSVRFGEINAIIIKAWDAPEGTPSVRIATNTAIDDTHLNSLTISENPLLKHEALTTLATNIKNSISSFQFVGGSAVWQGDPSVTVGDTLNITNLKSEVYSVLILNQSIILDGGFEITSGNALNSNTQKQSSDASMKILNPFGGINATAITTGTLDAKKVNVVDLDAENITVNLLKGNQIDANTLNVGFGNIKDLSTDTSIFRLGVGGELYLDRLVVNDANFASAIAGKLMIRDDNGKLYRISIDASGAVTSTLVQLDGDSLTENAVMSISQRLLWRQATAPSAPFIGMLWHDTTKDQLKRCISTSPLVWEIVPAGRVHTNVIDVDDNGMNILTGGDLNLLAGSNINIKNLGNTANIINMDSSGMTLSSTGKLNILSTDAIQIGGMPIESGGTNLLLDSERERSATGYWEPFSNLNDALFAGQSHPNWGTQTIPYTLSMDIRADAAETISIYSFPSDKNFNLFAAYPSIGTSYKRWTHTFYPSITGNGGATPISIYASGKVYIKKAKLEIGHSDTAWSPSPDDPASGVKTSHITIAADNINLASGGTFTVASDNFKIDSSGNVTLTGKITSTSGNIGGFALSAGKLEASPVGKPKLTLDTADSKIVLGDLQLLYNGVNYELRAVGVSTPIMISAEEVKIGNSGATVITVYPLYVDVLQPLQVTGHVYATTYVSAEYFIDRTEGYKGTNALSDIKKIKNDKRGNIDHATLPNIARKAIKDQDGKETDGRDLGAMISLLTKAVQELTDRIETLEGVKK